MDSKDFIVTMDSREDATLEELSGERGESREVVEAGENVIPMTDGEEEDEMEEDGESSGSDEEAELVTLTSKKKDPTPVRECGAIKIEGGT